MNAPTTHPARQVAGLLTAGFVAPFAWFWSLIAVLAVGLAASDAAFGELNGSVWQPVTASSAKYFLLVVGIMTTTSFLRVYVLHGITRRHFATGAGAFAAAFAAGSAVVMLLGFAAERLVYRAAGIPDRSGDPYPVSSAADAAAYGVRAVLIYAAYLCAGWLIGTGYYRFGARWGTAFLLPAVLPAVLTEVLFATEWSLAGRPFEPTQTGPVSYPVAVAGGVAVVAVGYLAVRLLLRDIPVRRPAG